MQELLSFDEAAKLCKIHVRTLKRAVTSGRLSAIRLGESARSDKLHPNDLQDYIDSSRTVAPAKGRVKARPISKAELSNWPK